MILTKRSFLGHAAATMVAIGTPTMSLGANAETAAIANRKINIAGRQRMLSQRMAMAAFYARLNIAPEQHITILSDAYALFEKSLAGLRSGSADLGLPVEDHPSVLAALDRVDLIWERYGAAIAEIAANDGVAKQELGVLAALNMKVLARANVVVKKLVAAYGGVATSEGRAIAIDVAGRQRMLSQKMVKEGALIGLNYKRTENREFLTETIELFDDSLFGLMYGNEALKLPKPPAIVLAKLQEVEALWLDSYPILEDIAASGRADKFDLQAVALNRDPLLTTMNEAVGLYEAA